MNLYLEITSIVLLILLYLYVSHVTFKARFNVNKRRPWDPFFKSRINVTTSYRIFSVLFGFIMGYIIADILKQIL